MGTRIPDSKHTHTDQGTYLKLLMHEKGLGHRCRVGQPRGLDQNMVKFAGFPLEQVHKDADEVPTDSAADAYWGRGREGRWEGEGRMSEREGDVWDAQINLLTAIIHLHNVLCSKFPALHQGVVHANLPKLVLNDGDALPVLRSQDVVQQGLLMVGIAVNMSGTGMYTANAPYAHTHLPSCRSPRSP